MKNMTTPAAYTPIPFVPGRAWEPPAKESGLANASPVDDGRGAEESGEHFYGYGPDEDPDAAHGITDEDRAATEPDEDIIWPLTR